MPFSSRSLVSLFLFVSSLIRLYLALADLVQELQRKLAVAQLEAGTQRARAEEEKARAEEEKARAEEEKARAEEEKARAEEEKARAEEEKARNYAQVRRDGLACLRAVARELREATRWVSDSAENKLRQVLAPLRASVETVDEGDLKAIRRAISSPGPTFSEEANDTDPSDPSSPSTVGGAVLFDDNLVGRFPQLPTLTSQEAFTKLGGRRLSIERKCVVWSDPIPSCPANPVPAWFDVLMEVMDHLLLLLWVQGGQLEQPLETKGVQPVLQAVLAVVGAHFGFSVRPGNSLKLVVRAHEGGLFPKENLVGATDLIVEWSGCFAVLVEVKVLFNARKYFQQAVAQGYGAVAGLNSSRWDMVEAFGRADRSTPRVILWNGPLMCGVRIDALSQCCVDRAPHAAGPGLWRLFRQLAKELSSQGEGPSPFSPPAAPSKRKPDDDNGGGEDAPGRGPPRSSSRASRSLDFGAGGKGKGARTMNRSRMELHPRDPNIPSPVIWVAKLTENNLAIWNDNGYDASLLR
jgi:hypothetical protein